MNNSPYTLNNKIYDEIMNRRQFIKTTSSSAIIGAGSFLMAGCEKPLKKMKMGRTGMQVSRMFGDMMTDRTIYELALNAGVNYWHKIGHWNEPTAYDIFQKLDRDSFYCDTTVGSLNRDKAIEIFEGCLKKTGLTRIDGFKVHSQYRYAEDIKNNMGVIQAFEYLKKQGKTRFLMMSQHINTAEVFEAAVESDLFDSIQIPLNPTVPRDYFTSDKFDHKATQDEYLALIKKASEKGIAITAMKTFLYGPKYWDEVPDLKERVKNYLPDNGSIATALIHWTLNVPGVVAFGNMLLTFEQLQENLIATGGEMSDIEDRGLKAFTETMNNYICRFCGACETACPCGVAVADILRFSGYYASHPSIARNLYATLPKHRRVDAVKDLSIYEKSCPYDLPVVNLLRKAQMELA